MALNPCRPPARPPAPFPWLVQTLSRILDRTHLAANKERPYPETGVGYEVRPALLPPPLLPPLAANCAAASASCWPVVGMAAASPRRAGAFAPPGGAWRGPSVRPQWFVPGRGQQRRQGPTRGVRFPPACPALQVVAQIDGSGLLKGVE